MWTHSPQTIDDLLGDSLIQAVMRADRVEPRALKVMLTGVGARVAAHRQEPKLVLDGARVRFAGETKPGQEAPTLLLAPPARMGERETCFCR
jgi:hypothetical protein